MKISLKAARVNANLTQEDAAKQLRKGKQTITNWENGYTTIDTANFMALCSLYGVRPNDIFLPKRSNLKMES